MSDHPIVELLTKLQYDLTGIQARLTEAKRQVIALNLVSPLVHRCDDCGLSFRGLPQLAEHAYLAHGGAEPEHWLLAEAMAQDPEEAAA